MDANPEPLKASHADANLSPEYWDLLSRSLDLPVPFLKACYEDWRKGDGPEGATLNLREYILWRYSEVITDNAAEEET